MLEEYSGIDILKSEGRDVNSKLATGLYIGFAIKTVWVLS